jgi:predicted TIM-barrel fold metal-dependent hydrolase
MVGDVCVNLGVPFGAQIKHNATEQCPHHQGKDGIYQLSFDLFGIYSFIQLNPPIFETIFQFFPKNKINQCHYGQI